MSDLPLYTLMGSILTAVHGDNDGQFGYSKAIDSMSPIGENPNFTKSQLDSALRSIANNQLPDFGSKDGLLIEYLTRVGALYYDSLELVINPTHVPALSELIFQHDLEKGVFVEEKLFEGINHFGADELINFVINNVENGRIQEVAIKTMDITPDETDDPLVQELYDLMVNYPEKFKLVIDRFPFEMVKDLPSPIRRLTNPNYTQDQFKKLNKLNERLGPNFRKIERKVNSINPKKFYQNHDHRKAITIKMSDNNSYSFLLGFNIHGIGSGLDNNLDYAIGFKGEQITDQFNTLFFSEKDNFEKDVQFEFYDEDGNCIDVFQDAGIGSSIIMEKAKDMIRNANQSVTLISQYLPFSETTKDSLGLYDEILNAIERGVSIKLVIPDPELWSPVYKYKKGRQILTKYSKLVEEGKIQIDWSKRYVHTKGIITEKEAMIGSHNFEEDLIKLGTAEIAFVASMDSNKKFFNSVNNLKTRIYQDLERANLAHRAKHRWDSFRK